MGKREAMIDMTDAEVEARYREIIQQQGQDAAMTLIEVGRRATLKVNDAALKVYEAADKFNKSSERLERFTKVLIWLTSFLAFLAIFPAVDFVMKLRHERETSIEGPEPARAVPAKR
jgi:hypothetical protein